MQNIRFLQKTPFKFRSVRLSFYVLLMLPFILSSFIGVGATPENEGLERSVASEGANELVYVVYVHDTIERGLLAYMERSFRAAEEAEADHIVLDINTPGGTVDAASDIGDLMYHMDIPITAFVNPNATSAGAFIALNADYILMLPTASMGAATVVNLEGTAGDAKALAFWISKMTGAAKHNDRDPLYAEAMVDPTIVIEGLTSADRPLDFDAPQAYEYGYAEAIVDHFDDVLAFHGMENATVEYVDITYSEHLARFITHPIVSGILLSLASLGLILELYSPGFGVPGAVGLSSLLLFFFGHLVAGFAGYEAIIIFVVGLILIVIELIMPGFGIFGILGIAAVIVSLGMASIDWTTGLINIGVALVLTVVAMIIMGTFMNRKGMWSRLVLQEGVATVEGQTQFTQRKELVGKTGYAVTALRPSGAAMIEGQRYDVVSDSTFIPKDTPVEIILVEGPRLVVRALDEEN